MIAFVAEAPAWEEVDAGQSLGVDPIPLVGASGRLFGRLLRMAGLARPGDPPRSFAPDFAKLGLRPLLWERSNHIVANVWPYKLENNELATLFAQAKEARENGYGEAEWYMGGYGWLRPEHRGAVEDLRSRLVLDTGEPPDVIVTLGAAALWAFTGSSALTESRGVVLRASRVLPSVKLVPTLHPAHILQDFRMLGVVAADIARAAKEATDLTKIIHTTAREIWIEPTSEDLHTWWDRYGYDPIHRPHINISVDIETQHGQLDCIAFAVDPVHAICVPFVDWRKPNRNFWVAPYHEAEAWDWVSKVLDCPAPKVFQNGLFDLSYLWGRLGITVRNYRHDTRLMHHVLQPELPKSLAFMGATYANPPGAWKTLRTGEEKRDA